MLNKESVSKRLRDFGLIKFGSMKNFAAALGISPANLNSAYLTGRSLPGAEILSKLDELGCDITWLLTGVTSNEAKLKQRILELEAEIKLKDERWVAYTEGMKTFIEQNNDNLKEITKKLNKIEPKK